MQKRDNQKPEGACYADFQEFGVVKGSVKGFIGLILRPLRDYVENDARIKPNDRKAMRRLLQELENGR